MDTEQKCWKNCWPLKILLADDNRISQQVGWLMLENLGHTVDLAENGIEVLKMLKHNRYDIIFMDLQMPEMDGLEATAEIVRTYPPEQRPKIIAYTGDEKRNRDLCIAVGMDDFLRKPFRVDDFQAMLEKWGVKEDAPQAE